MATWNIMLNIKGILQSIFLELKALENAFGGVSSKVAITNILHGGHDGSYVQAPCPQEASDASSTWLAFPEVGLGLALLQLLLGAKATGRASLIQEVTSSPKRWMRGLNATLVGTSLMVQWLRRHTSTTGDAGLIPGGGTRTPYTL